MPFVPSPDQLLDYPMAFPDIDFLRAIRDASRSLDTPPTSAATKLASLLGMVSQTARGAAGLSPITPLETAISGVVGRIKRRQRVEHDDTETTDNLAAQDNELHTVEDAGERIRALADAVRSRKARKAIVG